MKNTISMLAVLALAANVCGCKNSSDNSSPSSAAEAGDPSTPIAMDDLPPSLDGVHSHPDHGPHGGELVELGNDAFHIEIVHGVSAVAFYVLDNAVVDPVAIDADKLTVSLKHDGEVQSFELKADPQTGDKDGMSSRFTSTDERFSQWMNAEAEGAVTAQIDGKSYTGKIAHDHGHSHPH